MLALENWNGYGEAVHIEPCAGFKDDAGVEDPDIYLKILAESLGGTYAPPVIPNGIVDPIRLSAIPPDRVSIQPGAGAATLLLTAGYTAIALPVAPAPALTAERLALEINRQGGTCSLVLRYVGGQFETHAAGTTLADFPIVPGQGYFVRCATAGAWEVTGAPLDAANVRLDLVTGFNLVGLPLVPQTGYDAERVGREIGQQGGNVTQVVTYDNGAFTTHPVGTTVNNFPLVPGRGYFIRCGAPAGWMVTR